MSYIGNTQQKLKNRMDQHFAEMADMVNKGRKSDLFASHFAKHLENMETDGKISRQNVQHLVEMGIL